MEETSTNKTEEQLTKQQKKNKKKREAAKLKKKQDQSEKKVEAVTEELVDNYEKELCWCINQIQLGLKTQKAALDQVASSTKLLEQLKSKKTPKPKKRMLMKMNFGDYRNKMSKEIEQHVSVVPSFVASDEKVLKESIFIRKKINDLPCCSSSNTTEFRFNFPEPS